MKSCYITHTKITVLGTSLFDDDIIYSDKFNKIFGNKLCLSNYVNEIRLNNCPRIDDLGYVFLDKKNVREEIRSYNQESCSLYYENEYSSDERLSYYYFELYKPINILAYKDGIKAKGKIFIHFFPFGCISMTIALSLKGISKLNSEELKNAVKSTNPNKSQQPWIWRCKWGDMTLNDLIAQVESKITNSLFASFSPKSVNFNSKWYTSFTYTDIDKQNSDKYNEVRNCYICVRNNIIDENKRVVLLLACNNQRQKQLRTYWRIIRLQELILIKSALYSMFEHHLNKETLKIRNNRLGKPKDNFSDKYWNKSTVYNNELAAFIKYTDDIIKNSSSRYRYLYSMMSEYYGLNKSRITLINSQKEWIEECNLFKNPILNKITKILPFLSLGV